MLFDKTQIHQCWYIYEASGLQLQDAKNEDPLVSKDSDTPEVAPEVTPVSLETNAPEDLSFLDPTQDSISPT